MDLKNNLTLKTLLRSVLSLSLLGAIGFGLEQWGGQYITRFSSYVARQGQIGILMYIAVNAFAVMLLVPQVPFTVAAGALFGWKWGTLWASLAMTTSAVLSFFIARYGVRDWLRHRFQSNSVYQKMVRVSRVHPLHVISLSRLIPVIPFPVASYLLGITEVRSLPFALLTWACMLPETLFLASGGHLLHSGMSSDRRSIEAMVVLCLAGVVLALVIRRMKRKIEEEGE